MQSHPGYSRKKRIKLRRTCSVQRFERFVTRPAIGQYSQPYFLAKSRSNASDHVYAMYCELSRIIIDMNIVGRRAVSDNWHSARVRRGFSRREHAHTSACRHFHAGGRHDSQSPRDRRNCVDKCDERRVRRTCSC